MQNDWDQHGSLISGGMPYSEGIYLDMNQVMRQRQYWDGGPTNETLAEYVRYEFGWGLEMNVTQAVSILETGLPYAKNSSTSQQALDLLRSVLPSMTDAAKGSWRWRVLYLRATIDALSFQGKAANAAALNASFAELAKIYYVESDCCHPSSPADCTDEIDTQANCTMKVLRPGFDGGGSGLANECSDVRLKTDIELLGLSASGVPRFSWRYLGGHGLDTSRRYVGTTAQALLSMGRHDAVLLDGCGDGYYAVDYARIPDVNFGEENVGLRLKSEDDSALNGHFDGAAGSPQQSLNNDLITAVSTPDRPRGTATCGCVPASLCRPLFPQPVPRAERLIFTSRHLNETANTNDRLWDYLPWDSANITTVVNFGGSDYNKLACEAHRHGARAIVGALDIPDITGKALALLNASWRADWVLSNVQRMGLTSKDGFDGINLDIEDFAGNSTLRDALTLLVCELRTAMTVALPGSQLSFDGAADPTHNGQHYDYLGISRCVDFIFPMAYTMIEAKHTNVASPNSPLPAVSKGLANYKQLGIDGAKLVLGLPFFGFDIPCTGLSSAACTILPGSWSTSLFEVGYGSIVGALLPRAGGSKVTQWNESAASPWFDYRSPTTHPPGVERHRVLYDNPRSIRAKVAMAEAAGVMGIGIWTATALPYSTDPTAASEMWAAVKTNNPHPAAGRRRLKMDDLFVLAAALVTGAQATINRPETPMMGWSSWNCFKDVINQTAIRQIADIIVWSGLHAAGYEFINLDNGWAAWQRDEAGNVVANQTKFPAGMKGVGDYLHERNLSFGIYTSRQNRTCGQYSKHSDQPGCLGHEAADAAQFMAFGCDFVKNDDCHTICADAYDDYGRMEEAIAAVDRLMQHGVKMNCLTPAHAKEVAQYRRVGGDLHNSWTNVMSVLDRGDDPFFRAVAGQGYFNDFDMMVVGLTQHWPQEGNTADLTLDENTAHFSLWAAMKSPLVLGNDLRHVSPGILSILLNTEVIAVNQDKLAIPATRVASSPAKVFDSKPVKTTLYNCSAGDERQSWTVDGSSGEIWQLRNGQRWCFGVHHCETKWPFTTSVSPCGSPKGDPKCEGVTSSQRWAIDEAAGTIRSMMATGPEAKHKPIQCEGDSTVNASDCCLDSIGVNPRVAACGYNLGVEQTWSLEKSSQPPGVLLKNAHYSRCLGTGGGLDVYAGPLTSGRYTAVLLNRSPAEAEITVNFTEMLLSGVVGATPQAWCPTCFHSVRDILAHKDLGQHAGSFAMEVNSHAVVHLVIEPKGTSLRLKHDDPMELTKLSQDSEARCLDGSPGSYYFSPGRSTGKFLIFMNGGGWCYPSSAVYTPQDTDSNCLWRSKGNLGSSLRQATTKKRPSTGMLSTNHAQSPFADWALININYCDGGSFTGLRTKPVVQNDTKVYYRGRAILDAVIADAKARHGLQTASHVVLSGGSAGGTATVANCDHVASLLPSTQTRCVADAGFFLDTPSLVGVQGHSVMRDRFFDVVDGMNSTGQLHPGCKEAGLDPRLCFFSEHALKYTKTPTFILNSLNNFMTWTILEPDPWAPGFPPGPHGWESCLVRGGEPTPQSFAKGCNRTQRAVIGGFRATFLAAAASALRGDHGCWLDSCPQNHEQHGSISTLSIRNQTAMAAIATWIAGKDTHVVDATFPSSTSECALGLPRQTGGRPLKSDDTLRSLNGIFQHGDCVCRGMERD